MRILVVSLALVMMVLLATLAAADWAAGEQPLPADTIGVAGTVAPVDQAAPNTDNDERLVSYSQLRNIWRFVSLAGKVLILGLIAFSGWAARLRDWVGRIRPKFFALWAFVTLLIALDYLLYLPFAIYRGFWVETGHGFLNQTFLGWWRDDLLGLLVEIVVAIVPIWLLYFCLERFRRWWLVFTGLLAPVIIFAIVLAPVVISPLFNDFMPLQDKHIESEIQSLADRAGIAGADIFEVNASKQSSKVNAYVTGLFGSKRIVLYDTLLDQFTLDEAKFVMAHEMGHYVKHHIWWGTLIAVVYLGLLFWLISRWAPTIIRRWSGRLRLAHLSNWASLPLVVMLLLILNFVLQPLTNVASRTMERQSDRYGLEMSGVTKEAAISTYRKLATINLSDPEPHPLIEFWFYSHPSLSKRIAFVENFRPQREMPHR
ncbi:MAG: M48 family metallopeptidase [bacterium]